MQTAAAREGIDTGTYLVVVGVVVALVGGAVAAAEREATLTRAGAGYAAVFGLLWAAGVGSIAAALGRYGGRISQLVPLYNMNALVAVVVGLVALGGWESVHPGRILAATALTVGGGVLAAASGRWPRHPGPSRSRSTSTASSHAG